jgi:hypothetical protein
MKKLLRYFALGVLSTQAFSAHAQTNGVVLSLNPATTNLEKFERPAPLFSSKHPAPPGQSKFRNHRPKRMLGTNTLAFDTYAVNSMLDEANRTRMKWGLQITKPLTTNDVAWDMYPMEYGFDGTLGTVDTRYSWQFANGILQRFYDSEYHWMKFSDSEAESAKLAANKSSMTTDEARQIAEDALNQLGFTCETLHLKKSPKVTQAVFDGVAKKYALPLYTVEWSDTEGARGYGVVKLEVSGITRKVVAYENYDWPFTPPIPVPANLHEMLNIKVRPLD